MGVRASRIATAIASAAVELETLTYERDGRIARITLDRPERGNGITLAMPRELADCVERANLDPEVHVIALAGNGTGFCGGYDLGSAEAFGSNDETSRADGSTWLSARPGRSSPPTTTRAPPGTRSSTSR